MTTGRGRFVGQGGLGLGLGGTCDCIKCGYSEPHEIGSPCMLKKCPKCGGVMRRKIG